MSPPTIKKHNNNTHETKQQHTQAITTTHTKEKPTPTVPTLQSSLSRAKAQRMIMTG